AGMNDQAAVLENYFRLMSCNGASRVYGAALRAGILDALRAGPMTGEEVAAKCGLAARPVGLVLDVLKVLGLVNGTMDGRYNLTVLAQSLLSGGYRELGGQYWDHLAEFLKSDQPIAYMDAVGESESHYQSQSAALAWMLSPAAKA